SGWSAVTLRTVPGNSQEALAGPGSEADTSDGEDLASFALFNGGVAVRHRGNFQREGEAEVLCETGEGLRRGMALTELQAGYVRLGNFGQFGEGALAEAVFGAVADHRDRYSASEGSVDPVVSGLGVLSETLGLQNPGVRRFHERPSCWGSKPRSRCSARRQ